MKTDIQTIEVNGISYVRADQASQPKPNGNRAVVVVDRGWIFAGDVTEENGRIKLARALHVFSWQSVGFAGIVADPKKGKADLRPVADVDIPKDAEVFRVAVGESWGL